MDPLADRADRAARHHPAAALPVRELARLVQDSGTRVPEHVLLRALLSEPRRFRIVDPWKGPWTRLGVRRHAGRPRLQAALRRSMPGLVDGPRVVPRPGAPTCAGGPAAAAADRMRRTLIHLGWRVDDHSPTDLARWHRLVLEGQRLGGRLEGTTS